jgi:hypothetical protein
MVQQDQDPENMINVSCTDTPEIAITNDGFHYQSQYNNKPELCHFID